MAVPPTPPGPDAPAEVRLGWELRVRREALALTRDDVAEALCYSVDRVKQVEHGIYPPSTRYMARWRQVYSVDDELLALWRRTQERRRRQRPRGAAAFDERLPSVEWSAEQTTALLAAATTEAWR